MRLSVTIPTTVVVTMMTVIILMLIAMHGINNTMTMMINSQICKNNILNYTGNCLELAARGSLNQVPCNMTFSSGCPDKFFFSPDLYRCMYANLVSLRYRKQRSFICKHDYDISINFQIINRLERKNTHLTEMVFFCVDLGFLLFVQKKHSSLPAYKKQIKEFTNFYITLILDKLNLFYV